MSGMVGQEIGSYLIIEYLGAGGMAHVYKAFHPRLERYAALKFIRPELIDGDRFSLSFEQEAKLLARLKHPNIVHIYDIGGMDDLLYLVMEYVTGSSLKDWLPKEGQLPFDRALPILTQVSQALDYAHDQGIVHLDVKPANILLTPDGKALLADFGIAKLLGPSGQATQTESSIGTPAYIAPEQIDHTIGPLGPRCDVYSLGVVVYEMLTGQPPFSGDTSISQMIKRLQGASVPPRTYNPGLPQAAERVLLKALAMDPADRYASAGAFIDDLVRAIPGLAPDAALDLVPPWWPQVVEDEIPPDPGEPPFKGLQSFDVHDAGLFFGREALAARLVERLHDERFLAVVGASGSGKSSLVRAGVIPALRQREPLADDIEPPERSERWPVHVLTPTAHPLEALALSLTRDVESVQAAVLMDDLRSDHRSLHLFAQRYLIASNKKEQRDRVLLVIDQFEELFTECRDPGERRAFIGNLLTAAAHPVGVVAVLITLRADFYHLCAQFDALREALEQHQAYIGPMTEMELRRAIELPAQENGWAFEPALVDLLLRDVGDEPGALPLLSHALLETWSRRRGRVLTLSGYAEAGTIHGAIAKSAEAVYGGLDEDQRSIARAILLRLTELGDGTQDTRRRALLVELAPRPEDEEAVKAVLHTLVEARLVTAERETVQVAHEALIREWPTLRGWLETDREGLRVHRHLTEAAREWERLKRDPGELYRGARLAQASEWAEGHDDALNPLERAFLAASEELARRVEAERELARQRELEAAHQLAEERARAASRLRRRALWFALAAVVAVLAAAAAGWFGLDARNTSNENAALAEQNAAVAATAQTLQAAEEAQRVEAEAARTEAEQQREEAERQARRALANQLAAQAPSYLDEQMDLAMLLAVQSYNTLDIPQTRGSILEVLDYRAGLLRIMHGHDATLHSVTFSPDNTILISADVRGTVILWDTETGEIIDYLIYQPFEMGDAFNLNRDVHPMALSPDGRVLALGDYDNPTLLLLDIPAREPIGPPLSAHSAGLRSIAFSPDGAMLATGSRDGTLILWDTETWEPIHSTPFDIFEVGVSALAFSPDGDTLVAAGCLARSADFPTHDCIQAEAMQWDVAALIEQSSDQPPVGHPVASPPGMVTSAAFSPDGRALAFSGCREVQPNGSCPNPEILLWDMEAGQVTGRLLPERDDPCSDVAFHPEGTLLASACGEFGVIDLWDTATLAHLVSTPGSGNSIYSLAFSRDGTMLASSGSTDGLVYLWDLRSLAAADIAPREGGGVSSLLADFPAVVWGLDFSPDGKMLGMSVLNGTIQIWNVETGQRIGEPLIGHTHPWPLSVRFSPDGTILASVGFDASVRLWDVASGEQIGEPLLGHTEKTNFIVFSLDGAVLFSASHDGTIRRWDVATGQPIGEPLTGHTGEITGVDLSNDGTTLATPSSDGTARLWDAMTGEPIGEPFTGHSRGAAGIDFSPDGSVLAVGSFGGIILLWDVETHQLMGEPLDAGGWRIWDLSFSPDGQVLAAACEDGMLRLWDVATGLPIGPPLNSQYAATFGVDFRPDGSILATCGKGVGIAGTVRFWDMDPEAWKARACAIAGRNLTQAEWVRYLPDVPYEITCKQWPAGK